MKKSLVIAIIVTLILSSVRVVLADEKDSDKRDYTKISALGVVDHIYSFYDDLARFEYKGKWGYIDIKGNIIIGPEFDYAYDFVNWANGTAKVIKGNKMGIINRQGQWVYEPIIDYKEYDIVDYNENSLKYGYVVIKKMNMEKSFQLLDKKGKEVFDTDFKWLEILQMRIKDIDKKNKNNEQIYFGILDEDRRMKFIGLDGQYLFNHDYDYISCMTEFHPDVRQLFVVEKDGKYGIIDINNTPICPIKYDDHVFLMAGNGDIYAGSENLIFFDDVYVAVENETEVYKSVLDGRVIHLNGTDNLEEVIKQLDNLGFNKIKYMDLYPPFQSALKIYDYTQYEIDYRLEGKDNYYSWTIREEAPTAKQQIIDRKYHALEVTNPYYTGTALANVFEKKEIDLIDFRDCIKVTKTIKGDIGYVEHDDYFFRYLEQIGDDWVYVLLDGEGNEIGRYRNYYEHYYTHNRTAQYNKCGSLLDSLYSDNANYKTIYNNSDDYIINDVNLELDKNDSQQHVVNMSITIIKNKIEEKIGDLFSDTSERDAIEISGDKEGNIRISILIDDWHRYDPMDMGVTPDLMNNALEVLKMMTNTKDGELIWTFMDNHIRSGKQIDCTVNYKFGDTTVKFEKNKDFEVFYKDVKELSGYEVIIVNE